MTKLQVANYLLGLQGSAPVTSFASNHPDLVVAQQRLEEADLFIQNKQFWWFNTAYNWKITPDAVTGELVIPADVLTVQVVSHANVIKRGDKLWNTATNSYQFTEQVIVNLKIRVDFDLLEDSVQDTIKYFAGVQICDFDLEDAQKSQAVTKFFTDSLSDMKKLHIKQQRRNVFNTPRIRQARARVRPYNSSKQSILFGDN